MVSNRRLLTKFKTMDTITIGLGVAVIFVIAIVIYKRKSKSSDKHVGPRPPKPPNG